MHRLELKIPPLVLLAIVGTVMWLASRATPAMRYQIPAGPIVALGLGAVGVGTAVAGVVSFRRAKTTVNPLNPAAATTLVTSGIYRVTRNPMYLGALILLLGWAVFLANAAALIFVPTFVLYMNRFQIGPEETALGAMFGSPFQAYCARVRRWV